MKNFFIATALIAIALPVCNSAIAAPKSAPKPTVVKQVDVSANVKELVRAFRIFKSRIDTGISYSDYSAEMAKINVALDEFIDETNQKNHPVFIELSNARREYTIAGNIWKSYFDMLSINPDKGSIRTDDTLADILIKKYGVKRRYADSNLFSLSESLSAIWAKGSESFDLAIALNRKK